MKQKAHPDSDMCSYTQRGGKSWSTAYGLANRNANGGAHDRRRVIGRQNTLDTEKETESEFFQGYFSRNDWRTSWWPPLQRPPWRVRTGLWWTADKRLRIAVSEVRSGQCRRRALLPTMRGGARIGEMRLLRSGDSEGRQDHE